MTLDEPKENEVTTQVNGLEVLISEEVKVFTDQRSLDYGKSPNGEGFRMSTGCAGCHSESGSCSEQEQNSDTGR